jgi:hypothetical protein
MVVVTERGKVGPESPAAASSSLGRLPLPSLSSARIRFSRQQALLVNRLYLGATRAISLLAREQVYTTGMLLLCWGLFFIFLHVVVLQHLRWRDSSLKRTCVSSRYPSTVESRLMTTQRPGALSTNRLCDVAVTANSAPRGTPRDQRRIDQTYLAVQQRHIDI